MRSDKTAMRNRLLTTHQRHKCATSVVIGGDQDGPYWLTFARRSGAAFFAARCLFIRAGHHQQLLFAEGRVRHDQPPQKSRTTSATTDLRPGLTRCRETEAILSARVHRRKKLPLIMRDSNVARPCQKNWRVVCFQLAAQNPASFR